MTYIYDGTWDGLMCLVYRTAEDGLVPEGIFREKTMEQRVLFETTRIENDSALAEATAALLKKRVSGPMWADIWFALLSDDSGIDMALWHVLERSWAMGRRAASDLADPCIDAVRRAARRTGGEYDKYLGLTRFRDTGGILYAEVEPDCDLLPLLGRHFAKRLSDRGWVIHDLRRGRAAIYDGSGWYVADMELSRTPRNGPDEEVFQELWRGFYRATTTRERLNYKCQRNHMPRKYWKHLTENPGELNGKPLV
ncbi:MAG: TIGR03915 family putative DNA repair protein [Synergistaceae bacterium]|jgi:probable DNA metabolism protein|nr:TIGR03915 family putative DNA repair protein [Synergistaceae bacterium]